MLARLGRRIRVRRRFVTVSGLSRVEYARARDGAHLAYRVSGSGPAVVLEIGAFGTVFSLEATGDEPRWQRFEDALGRFCRFVRFDARGLGLSDRLVGPPSVEQWATDALSVLDAARMSPVTIVATGYGAPVALFLAAHYPERVAALVLANSFARVVEDTDYSVGVSRARFEAQVAATVPNSDIGADIDVLAPSVATDEETRRWWSRESRRGLNPSSAAAMWEFFRTVDVRSDVATLSIPALIVRTIRNRFVPPALGGWLAEHLPGAHLVDIDSADHVLWGGASDGVLGEIEEFLTGQRRHSVGRRTLLTMLFTDIAGSTARNAADGDVAWLDQLGSHDQVITQELHRFGGTLVKTIGDGVLATFLAPSHALLCARAMINRVGLLGIPLRAAVHTAEVEQRNGDVLGLGVTIAARTLAHANAGDLLTTSTVAELLLGSAFRFDPRGTHTLKGVPGEWQLCAVAP
jgi:class 3 adenylate cyclase/pimeloyl-ACP methyl ester carboxylesterase